MNSIISLLNKFPSVKKLIRSLVLFIKGFYCYLYLIIFNNIFNGKYSDLYYVSFFSKNKFNILKNKIIKRNIEIIKTKNKVRLGFIVYTGSMWFLDKLFCLLKYDKRFEVNIIVGEIGSCNTSTRKDTYNQAYKYFAERYGANVVVAEDDSKIETYDILFYLTPYDFVNENLKVQNISLSKLICYVSYSYMLAENNEKFKFPIYVLSWKYFCDSVFYLKMVEKHIRVKTDNLVYCGYPKMDEFFTDSQIKRTKNKKVIIYAPHQSVHYKGAKSATFDINYRIILEFAKKYSDNTFWYIKPHPLLRGNSVLAGVFKNVEEYDRYIDEWNSLENAKSVMDCDYIDIFKESDAMVTDSVSFLAEYQFTGKPLLLLESGKQLYNDFGNALVKLLYSCKPDDTKAIESFIHNVLIDKDPMKDKRKIFFDENLNYIRNSGCLANEAIYRIIKDSL